MVEKLTHLKKLTDDFGVWQHFENGQILKQEGYALDDSARAFIVFLLYKEYNYAKVCLDYLVKSYKDGQYIGFFYENKDIRVFPSSEDAFGLAFWSLAFAKHNNFEVEIIQNLINKSKFEMLAESTNIRTISYALIAYSLLHDHTNASKCAAKIINNFDSEWNWFEDKLTYANALMPYALIEYAKTLSDVPQNLKDIIVQSINTLNRFMKIGKIPAPVGNRIWHSKNSLGRDIYGQQPIDAGFMVIMYCAAYDLLKDEQYLEEARNWVEWFYGNNIMKENLINEDFACADGIDEIGVSNNYGSESTIVYLWADYSISKYNL